MGAQGRNYASETPHSSVEVLTTLSPSRNPAETQPKLRQIPDESVTRSVLEDLQVADDLVPTVGIARAHVAQRLLEGRHGP